MKTLILVLLTMTALFGAMRNTLAQNSSDKERKSSLTGKVIDQETHNPVSGVTIRLSDSNKGVETDEKGEFNIRDLKYGTYRLTVTMVGYKSTVISDLVLSSVKPLEVAIELIPDVITTGTIDVEANYFQKNSDANTSVTNFDYEEIRRAPGANEDISRMMQGAPGVSIANDQRNDLIIRGGSPNENLILIDGIEIPNINHYGSQSTTGGAIGFINLKFIREADIYTGGFSSKYGDKLSGVVDIKFRDGSKKHYYNNIDLSFAGFGGIFEGPLADHGSYLVSIRRSYLDLLKGAIRLTAVPNYWDFNLKVNYDLSPSDRLSLIGFSALDKINFQSSNAKSVDDLPYNSDNNVDSYSGGINYQKIFRKGYFQAVVSNSLNKYRDDIKDSVGAKQIYKDNSYENETTVKTELNYSASKSISFNSGVGVKFGKYETRMYAEADTTPTGYPLPELNIDNNLNTYKLFGYFNLTDRILNNKLALNVGVRYDYFNYTNDHSTFSPRVSASYNVTPVTTINASYGIFHQTPNALWLNTGNNKDLSSIRCDHYIFGVDHFFGPEIKATAEVYYKKYNNYPVSVNDPTYILIDGGNNFGPNFVGEASSVGHGYVQGFDFSLEKKLSGNGLYGILSYSYSKSRFKAIAGDEKQGAFDPTHQLTLTAGYQVADDWLVGIKYKYMGGKPYTPFDIQKSIELGRGVYDMNNFNGAKYPAYSRLDVRVDKKFYMGKISLTTYFELQNVLNTSNVYSYFWNKNRNAVGTIYHWAFMPVGGCNVQF